MLKRLKLKTVLPIALAASLVFVSVSTPVTANAWSKNKQKQMPNIVETAVANGNFTTLAQALTCTDLVGVLQKKGLRFTVFAPTDVAFASLGLNKDNVCQSFSKHQLRNILLYHVNFGSKDASKVLSRDKLLMLNFRFAKVDASVPSIAGQKIAATDIRTSNGIIHLIDGVMLP